VELPLWQHGQPVRKSPVTGEPASRSISPLFPARATLPSGPLKSVSCTSFVPGLGVVEKESGTELPHSKLANLGRKPPVSSTASM
jgi:hypothetical protein